MATASDNGFQSKIGAGSKHNREEPAKMLRVEAFVGDANQWLPSAPKGWPSILNLFGRDLCVSGFRATAENILHIRSTKHGDEQATK